MTELPGTDWREAPWSAAEAQAQAPFRCDWRSTDSIQADGFLRDATMLEDEALPSVMRKCVAVARRDAPPRQNKVPQKGFA
jgi:hypothetical protein